MSRQHTTEDGYTLLAYASGYLDWGLKVSKDDDVLFDSPCYLSNDAYGTTLPDDDDDAAEGSDAAEGTPWTDAEWQATLAEQADDILMGCLPEGTF